MKLRAPAWLTRSYTSSIVLGLVGVVLIVAGMTIAGIVATLQAATALKQLQPQAAARTLPVAKVGATLCTTSTLGLVPDCVAWKTSLKSLSALTQLEQELLFQMENQQRGEPLSISALAPALREFTTILPTLDQQLQKTWVLQHVLSSTQKTQLAQAAAAEDTFLRLSELLTNLSTGSQTWIVLLQNSDELRATGGFPGSYLKLQLQDGTITELLIEDIYDADGQFTGFVPPPHGVAEYTSQGNGLRLPDANWHPDFPSSAEQLLTFFAQSNRTAVTGIGAVTLELSEDILQITGPIYLPDYQTHLTANNISQVLRNERSDFFPGSLQKKFVLRHALAALQTAVSSLSPEQQQQLLAQVPLWIAQKDIQLYAANPETQAQLQALQITGTLPELPFIALIESNVGINKANRFISRTLDMTVSETGELHISVPFFNAALPGEDTTLSGLLDERQRAATLVPSTGYANYQRVLVPLEYEVQEILYAGTPLTDWHDEVLEADEKPYRQIGFLLPLLPAEQKTLELTLTPTTPDKTLSNQTVTIFKQAGLPPVPYSITTPTQVQSFTLERDTTLTLQ